MKRARTFAPGVLVLVAVILGLTCGLAAAMTTSTPVGRSADVRVDPTTASPTPGDPGAGAGQGAGDLPAAPAPVTRLPAAPQAALRAVGPLLTLAAVVVVVLVLIQMRRVRRRPLGAGPGVPLDPADSDVSQPIPQPTAQADSSPDRSTTDPVIRAWLELEAIGASCGTSHHPAQTPSEFATAVCVVGGAPQPPLLELLSLYHRARFGSQPLDRQAADRAAAALRRIRDGLRTALTADAGSPERPRAPQP